jgi:uncharacterized membrane protein
MHYSGGKADRYGDRTEMLGVMTFMSLVAFGTSLLILNLGKIDPKKQEGNRHLSIKISWTIVVFITLLQTAIIFETISYAKNGSFTFHERYIVLLVSLLLITLGNFMNNIKPNYFMGFRTPWALESEDNWRQTHHLGSRVWFFGGLVMFVSALFLPDKYSSFIMIPCIIIMSLIPFIYSYSLFRKSKRQAE